MSRTIFSIILLVIVLLIDLYVFQAVKTVTQNLHPSTRKIFHYIYWGLTAIGFLAIVFLGIIRAGIPFSIRTYIMVGLFALVVSKLLIAIFLLLEDGWRLLQWLYYKGTEEKLGLTEGTKISRSQFFDTAILILGVIPFGGFIYGMVKGAYDYKVRKVSLAFPNLPEAFDGYRFVQITDMHSGSFRDTEPLKKAVELINKQKADLVVFTGDIVNNISDELVPHIETLRNINAPDGVLSILGNHDYGDYVAWDNDDMKGANLDRLKAMQTRELGWNLLLNTHHKIKRNNQEIAFIGIENWGAKANFPKYGKLGKAVRGTEEIPFKVLLSHDPSHWKAQVLPQYNDIDLMLSGHTHGMQFGVRIPGFQWSPVQYVYEQWAGLYQEGKQYLYVNVGLGFLGYPGRLGMRPEITVFELRKS